MRTIAHILPFPAVGGTEHATLRIVQAIDSSRFRSVAFRLPEADAVSAFFSAAGVPCTTYEPIDPSYRHATRYLNASLKLARQFRQERIDLVHCANVLAALHAALAAWLARRPLVCHVRGRFEGISRRDCSFLWPVNHFVFVSRNTWDHFACRVPPSRGIVVYDGIDVPAGGDNPESRLCVRREFNIPPDAPLIGMIARVAPQKDFVTLAKAAARVVREVPDARFMVAGDHELDGNRQHYATVQKILADSGVSASFIFTGHRQDVGRLLSAFDIFVLSTHREGLPLVILEAMSKGKPVVATSVDGIPEIVAHDTTGLLVPHQDDRQLAAHLLTILRDPMLAARFGEAGRRLVETRFTSAQFAATMNDVYARLLEA